MRYSAYGLFIVMACVSAVAAEERIAVGSDEFPASVAGVRWIQVYNFAADGGLGGVAVSYRASTLKVDIHLFDVGDPSWAGKSLDERFVLEAINIPFVWKDLERRGIYSDVKLGETGDAKAGTLSFTHLSFSYTEKGEKKKSHCYLAKYRGRLLKIRITVLESVEDAVIEKAFSDAVAPFGKSA